MGNNSSTSHRQSSSPTAGQGNVSGQQSSSPTAGQGNVSGQQSSSPTAGQRNVSGQQSSSPTAGQRNVSGQQSSSPTAGQGNVSGQQSSSPTAGQRNVSGQQSSSPTAGQGNVSGQQSSGPTAGQGNVSGQQSSSPTAGQRNVSGQQSSSPTAGQRNVSGQQSSSPTAGQEKCYDPGDTTLTFVDGNDDLDFLCEDFNSLRAKMSCGHAVTPMSLTNHCRRLLDEGKCRFVCGMSGCDVEWTYEEVCKMALLTPEEMDYFEKKMFSNYKHRLNAKSCPGCKSSVMRTSLSDLSVKCTVCTADKKRTFMFCWQCLREWKGPVPRSDRCGNDGCISPLLETLRNCPNITFKDVKGVTGCPSIRACPTCGELVGHSKEKCKNVVCPRCKVEFCFVCLKLTKECLKLKPDSYYGPCSSGVAPRQTSIPVWKST